MGVEARARELMRQPSPPVPDTKGAIKGLLNMLEARDREIGQLRAAFRINGYRQGASDAEIDKVLNECKG